MTKLVVDLDKTAFVIQSQLASIHPNHDLKDIDHETQSKIWRIISEKVRIINPKELAALFEIACQEFEGLMVLTSGTCWKKNHIIQLFLKNLNLSSFTCRAIENLEFHSPQTDLLYFADQNLTCNEIALLPKSIRLEKIFYHTEANPNTRYVLFDDSTFHCKSVLLYLDNVTPVLADSKNASKDYYKQAASALRANAILELLTFNKQRPRIPQLRLFGGCVPQNKTSTEDKSVGSPRMTIF